MPLQVCDASVRELESFWLRKTGKAVLAVLVTQKPGEDPVFWRGMNCEVSMPTGTLCAERNAIGNALAGDQTMTRNALPRSGVMSARFVVAGRALASLRDASHQCHP